MEGCCAHCCCLPCRRRPPGAARWRLCLPADAAASACRFTQLHTPLSLFACPSSGVVAACRDLRQGQQRARLLGRPEPSGMRVEMQLEGAVPGGPGVRAWGLSWEAAVAWRLGRVLPQTAGAHISKAWACAGCYYGAPGSCSCSSCAAHPRSCCAHCAAVRVSEEFSVGGGGALLEVRTRLQAGGASASVVQVYRRAAAQQAQQP